MSGTERPVDFTQERFNRFARSLDDLHAQQKMLTDKVARGFEDIARRLDRIEGRMTGLEQEVRAPHVESIDQMGQILTAQHRALQTDNRLTEHEVEFHSGPAPRA